MINFAIDINMKNEEIDNKALRNIIRELSKVVPSNHLISTGFLMDLLNSPYNETWFQNNKKGTGDWGQHYIEYNISDKIDKAEETLGNLCQELLNQGKEALYKFVVFLVKSYCRNSEITKVELRGLKIALRSIGILDLYELEKYAKATPLIESVINISSWPEISNAVDRILQTRSIAESEIEFQNVGNSCRELIICLAQIVYNPSIHGDKNNEGNTIGKTDAMGMLTNYFNYTLSGSSNDEYRSYAKATHKIANMLTHKRNATKKDMLITVSATLSLINLVGVIEGKFD